MKKTNACVLRQKKQSGRGKTYRRNHTVTLALPVRHIATMVNHDVASLPWSLGTYKPLHRDNGGRVGLLGLVRVEGWLLSALQIKRRNSNLALARLLDRHAEHLVRVPGPCCLALPCQRATNPWFVAETNIVGTLYSTVKMPSLAHYYRLEDAVSSGSSEIQPKWLTKPP